MLDTRYMTKSQILEVVNLWLQFSEREARAIAKLDAILDGTIEQHLSQFFTSLANRELKKLRRTEQNEAAAILEQRLQDVPFYDKGSDI